MLTSKKFRATALTAIVLGFLAFLFWPAMVGGTSPPSTPASPTPAR